MLDGVGILLREAFADRLLATERPAIDWLEIVPEDFLERGAQASRLLDALAERFRLVPHAVSLSLGSPDALDDALVRGLARVVEKLDPPWWSEHLGCVRVDGEYTQAVIPLPMTEETVEHVAARAREALARVERPLLLENLAVYTQLPGTMDEARFLGAVTEQSGCELLLDLGNLWLNEKNFGIDAAGVIDELPIERVREIHLAGHEMLDGIAVDAHDSAVPEEVWPLYRRVIARAKKPVATLVEWEVRLPPFETLLFEVERARRETESALASAP